MPARVAIVDYQAGNLASVHRALAALGVEAMVTSDPEAVRSAERVIFPGVGAAGSCMANLRAQGLDAALADVVAADRPLLGICIGMQLLFDFSDEDGGVPCLGLLPGIVERFNIEDPAIKIPHMGWNAVTGNDPLFDGIPQDTHFYFVHSYYCAPGTEVDVTATADHGGRFCVGVRRGALAAVQFHPEKSGDWGLRMLQNFVA